MDRKSLLGALAIVAGCTFTVPTDPNYVPFPEDLGSNDAKGTSMDSAMGLMIGSPCDCAVVGTTLEPGICLAKDGSSVVMMYDANNGNARYPVLPNGTICTIHPLGTFSATLNADQQIWSRFQNLLTVTEYSGEFHSSAGKISTFPARHNEIFALKPDLPDFRAGTFFIWGKSEGGEVLKGKLCASQNMASDCLVP